MKGKGTMRQQDSLPAILPFPQRPACGLGARPLKATSEFPPSGIQFERVDREELRTLRAKLLDMILTNEQRRRLSRLKIAN